MRYTAGEDAELSLTNWKGWNVSPTYCTTFCFTISQNPGMGVTVLYSSKQQFGLFAKNNYMNECYFYISGIPTSRAHHESGSTCVTKCTLHIHQGSCHGSKCAHGLCTYPAVVAEQRRGNLSNEVVWIWQKWRILRRYTVCPSNCFGRGQAGYYNMAILCRGCGQTAAHGGSGMRARIARWQEPPVTCTALLLEVR